MARFFGLSAVVIGGQSALVVASGYGQSAVVSVLVEYGATVDLQEDVSIVNIKKE